MRPTHSNAFDAPSKDFHTVECVDTVDENSKPVMLNIKPCADAWADEDNIIHGAPYGNVLPEFLNFLVLPPNSNFLYKLYITL